MRIGVDCHVLSGKHQGSKTYLSELYRSVLARNPRHQFTFFGYWDRDNVIEDGAHHVDFANGSRLHRLTIGTAPLVRKHEIDLYHASYISPLRLGCKRLVTIHDILFESHPEFFTTAERFRNQLFVRMSARSAQQIHTISEFTQYELVNRYGIEPERIRLVPCGVDLNRFTPDGREESRRFVRKRYGLESFLLTVGRIEPRKNHIGLIKAYEIAKRHMPDLPPLLIVGQPDFGFQGLFRRLNEHPFRQMIRIVDDADSAVLPHLYRAADLFLYVSFAEGLGIPPLEAMASGTPTIMSSVTGMAEVCGNVAIPVSPDKPNEIAEAIVSIIGDPGRRQEMRVAGRNHARRWSWERAAGQYESAIDELEDTVYREAESDVERIS